MKARQESDKLPLESRQFFVKSAAALPFFVDNIATITHSMKAIYFIKKF